MILDKIKWKYLATLAVVGVALWLLVNWVADSNILVKQSTEYNVSIEKAEEVLGFKPYVPKSLKDGCEIEVDSTTNVFHLYNSIGEIVAVNSSNVYDYFESISEGEREEIGTLIIGDNIEVKDVVIIRGTEGSEGKVTLASYNIDGVVYGIVLLGDKGKDEIVELINESEME